MATGPAPPFAVFPFGCFGSFTFFAFTTLSRSMLSRSTFFLGVILTLSTALVGSSYGNAPRKCSPYRAPCNSNLRLLRRTLSIRTAHSVYDPNAACPLSMPISLKLIESPR